MVMQNALHDFIYHRVVNAKKAEVQEILAAFSETTLDKGAFFKESDTVITSLGFLAAGSARTYFVNEKGVEITDEILDKNNFISDIISVRTGQKTPMVIEMLERSQVFVSPMPQVWDLLSRNVTFNILIREHMGDRAMTLQKRHLLFLNGTAKERYEFLLATNPMLLQKYPLRFIASMIGVTQTQLSRIRNEIS